MQLSQVQIIQSLGEALAWFQKELGWGVEAAELRHLTGRIGELYAAMITRGQMALETNQRGYDVVSADNERISVKTITSSSHVAFRKSTFPEVDRVMILRINVDETEASIETVFDGPATEVLARCKDAGGDLQFSFRTTSSPRRPLKELKILAQARWGMYSVSQYENGTIIVEKNGSRDVRYVCPTYNRRCNRRQHPKQQRQCTEHETAWRGCSRSFKCAVGCIASDVS